MRKARTTFASNFFSCAGYEIIDNIGFDSVVVCSSDDEYAVIGPQVFEQIGGSAIVVIAGDPACKDELKKLGIMHFIHIKSNVLETLLNFHDILAVK